MSQSYFNNYQTQLYLILQTLYHNLKRVGDTQKVISWKSKGLLIKKIFTPTTTDISLSPSIKWCENSNFYVIFRGSCLKQKKSNFYSSSNNNFFIVYDLDTCSQDLNFDFILKKCLFGGVKLAKNSDPDKCV